MAASRRSPPIDRIENQVADLAQRVERLTANASEGFPTEHLPDPLEALRSQPSVVAAIERRLEEFSGRLDHEVAAALARPDIRELESAARRIEEALQQSQFAATRIEASLDALNAKLEGAQTEALAAEVRNLSDKLDAIGSGRLEASQIEPLLAEIVAKISRRAADIPEIETGALASFEPELKSIRVAVDGAAAAFDVQAVERLADIIARRLEDHFEGSMTAAISEVAQKRFDDLAGRLGQAEGLERAARDLPAKLQEQDQTHESGRPTEELAEQMSAIRQERAAAERRTEALLQGVRNVLDTLIDRLPAEDTRAPPCARPRDEDERVSGVQWVGAPRNVDAGRFDAAQRLDPERPGSSRESSDEFLLEPGAAAPQRLQTGAYFPQAAGLRTNPAISAHIAAARRAAQSALAENIDASTGWPNVEKNVQQARRFFARHRQSVLMALALALAVTAVVWLMDVRHPLFQKSEMDQPSAKAATTRAVPGAANLATGVAQPASVDPAPTGSIGRGQTRPKAASRAT